MITKNQETFRVMNEMGRQRLPFFFLINFDASEGEILEPDEATNLGIYFQIGGKCNYTPDKLSPFPFVMSKFPVDYLSYKLAFDRVMQHILFGDTYLLNLTFATPIETNISIGSIFQHTKARYKLLYKDKFVVFSPESFVKIDKGIISTYPMKGTIDASIENAEAKILDDSKELAEHNTIVDLLRNDLSIVATNVKLQRFRYIEKIMAHDIELLQISSEIAGDLPQDYHGRIGDILQAMLPAGSVTGAPKKRTLEIIREVENYDRGFYTGICGYYDGQNLDSAVMIRFIEITSKGPVFKSGGGITFASDPLMEYKELTDKVYVPIV